MAPSTLSEIYGHNLATFRRQPWAEISGSLGDLGTFLPIVIALSGRQTDLIDDHADIHWTLQHFDWTFLWYPSSSTANESYRGDRHP